MNITRQYNLPKCSLHLEGVSSASPEMEDAAARPLLSVLLNAECQFTDLEQRLSGGRDFLESLATAVSQYAQEVLSGLAQPAIQEDSLVSLHASETPGHHALRWSPPDGETVELDLTTLQLADLVDAIDQFFADHRTLPDLTLQLAPVSRRYRQADVPVTVRAQPIVTGLGSLAIAAALLFMVPIPEVTEPEVGRSDETTQTDDESGTEQGDEAGDNPDDAANRAGSAETISAAALEDLLDSDETITDATEVKFIQQYLYRELDQAWEERGLAEDLAFRVTATIDGSIVDYEAIDGTSEGADEETPLPDLKFLPTQAAIAQREATVDYKVVFTSGEVLQINPWDGYQGSPTLGDRIEDPDTLAEIQEELADTLREDWDEEADTRGSELVFRVGVTEDGSIADYQAQNNAAFTLASETPLPNLLNPEAAGIGREQGSVVPQEPLGQFRVVFREGGVVEVSPY